MGIELSDVRDADGLAAIAPEWWDLWQRCPSATPFQTPAWLVSWWRAFHPGRLFTIAARRQGSLVGLAPFYLDGRRLLPFGISLSDYLDLLIDPQFADDVGPALLHHLSRTDLQWDEWELPDLQPGATALGLACPSGLTHSIDDQNPCPVLPLPSTVDDLSEVLPWRKRRQIRTARNRAARRGEVAVERVEADRLEHAYAELVRLHEARWQSRGEPGVLADPRVRRCHSLALEPLSRHGLLRFYVLSISGQAASVYLGFQHQGRAYGYLVGFDPDYAFESPGTILLAHAIEEAVREGAREFHFLRGKEDYKYGWGASDRWNKRRIFRRVHAHAEA